MQTSWTRSSRFPPYLVLPLKREVFRFRQRLKKCGFGDDVLEHVLETHMYLMANREEATKFHNVELQSLMDDLGLKQSMTFRSDFGQAVLEVLDALFNALVAANAFDEYGNCPYTFHTLLLDDVILEHYDLYPS